MSFYHWKPSKAAKKEFAEKMDEIDDFCAANGISRSLSNDSYYFTVRNKDYRVSNHSVESSNRGARREDCLGNIVQVRDEYHPNGREEGITYIHASKTRIIEIYNDLKKGFRLDGLGNRANRKKKEGQKWYQDLLSIYELAEETKR